MIHPWLFTAILWLVPTLVLVAIAALAFHNKEEGIAGSCLIVSSLTFIFCFAALYNWNAEVWNERHGKNQPAVSKEASQ